ncbi:MAG: hypothetical protein AB1730_00350 [Myxococcota bacterium]
MPVTASLRTHFSERQDAARTGIGTLHLKAEDLVKVGRRSALIAEHQAGRIFAESYDALLADVDARPAGVQLECE